MNRTCLIVRGGWHGHDPVGTSEIFIPELERLGYRVDVLDVFTTPEVYADREAMARYDLVVQCITGGEITGPELEGLRRAVAAGTGLAGWHGGLLGAFDATPAYLQLIGMRFAAHPHAPEDRDRAGAPAYRAYAVRPTAAGASHPITREMGELAVRTEQYWVLDDGLCDPLASTVIEPLEGDEWAAPVEMPVAWTRRWGAGRMFGTTLGHTRAILEQPEVKAMVVRGLDWAAR